MATGTTRTTKGRKLPGEVLRREEVAALMRACSTRAPTGRRNRALLALLYRSGLRISEALALKPRDLDAKAGTVRVRRGKGGKARTVGMDAEAFDVLARWLDTRKGLGINGTHPVFCTLKGGPVAAAYVRSLLPRLARKAGIDRRVHAHALRHTLAVELVREGISVEHIRKQLGHASLSTTAKYLAGLSPEETVQAMRGREWEAPR